ncbi:MAG: DUF1294 domain-containing protein [Bacilli bacterium]|nr:DUF1294 domain-containing protein [Bacilli bacterium]MBP3920770.1 DUF1294 domain-containing protein [Bacilli bacterium]
MTYYLIIINIITLITYKIDKQKSKENKRRISEKTLITLAFIGGALGAHIGMYTFHHKTKKIKFKLLIPLSLIMWIFIIYKINY